MTKRLLALGALSIIPYIYALRLQNLRSNIQAFEIAFFAAFGLYAGVTILALRIENFSNRALLGALVLATILQALLLFTRPSLSDDMYRYVWDGRVQALGNGGEAGISPYLYPPNATELANLRDRQIWPQINRKSAVTIYPPAAEMAYLILWRIWPDNASWFQAVMAAAGLLAGGLLAGVLKTMGRSTGRALIYLWSPLLAFETAHSAHVDALVLPLIVGAWWARMRERDGLVGVCLGLATAIKLYPALLVPALWRPKHPKGRWRLPLAFGLTLFACYLPYLLNSGTQVIGFLPQYVRETFNVSPAIQALFALFRQVQVDPREGVLMLMLASLGIVGLVMVLRPAASSEAAIRRSLWIIGIFTLLSQNLFSWYLLWLLPLIAIFLEQGRPLQLGKLSLPTLRLDAWTGWWLFSGLIVLSYTFFIDWKPVPGAIWGQYLPLYAFLLIDFGRQSGISSRLYILFVHPTVKRYTPLSKTRSR